MTSCVHLAYTDSCTHLPHQRRSRAAEVETEPHHVGRAVLPHQSGKCVWFVRCDSTLIPGKIQHAEPRNLHFSPQVILMPSQNHWTPALLQSHNFQGRIGKQMSGSLQELLKRYVPTPQQKQNKQTQNLLGCKKQGEEIEVVTNFLTLWASINP